MSTCFLSLYLFQLVLLFVISFICECMSQSLMDKNEILGELSKHQNL